MVLHPKMLPKHLMFIMNMLIIKNYLHFNVLFILANRYALFYTARVFASQTTIYIQNFAPSDCQ